MATYIKTLKEDNGDITYPQTKAGAVLLNNGSDLETELSNYVTAEDIASTADVDHPITTSLIADGAVTPAKLAPGIVTMQRTTLFESSGTAANITVSQALNNFDEVEFWFRDTNSTPNQLIRTIPGSALAIVLDIPHPGASNYIYWNVARWNWSAGGTTLTYGSSHYQKNLAASAITTSTSTAIQITKIVGIKFVSN